MALRRMVNECPFPIPEAETLFSLMLAAAPKRIDETNTSGLEHTQLPQMIPPGQIVDLLLPSSSRVRKSHGAGL